MREAVEPQADAPRRTGIALLPATQVGADRRADGVEETTAAKDEKERGVHAEAVEETRDEAEVEESEGRAEGAETEMADESRIGAP